MNGNVDKENVVTNLQELTYLNESNQMILSRINSRVDQVSSSPISCCSIVVDGCDHTTVLLSKKRRWSLIESEMDDVPANFRIRKIGQDGLVAANQSVMVPQEVLSKDSLLTSESQQKCSVDPKEHSDSAANSEKDYEFNQEIPMYCGTRNDCLKPPHTYSTLISQAILSAPNHRQTLSKIYQYIWEHYQFYRSENRGWQNSIRHNLSMNRCFERVIWNEGRVEDGQFGKKGSWWRIREEFLVGGEDGQVHFKGVVPARRKSCTPKPLTMIQPIIAKPSPLCNLIVEANDSDKIPVNKMQYDMFMDSLLLEDREDCDIGRCEVEELCSVLQSIHSVSN